jgi:hypothetical protein
MRESGLIQEVENDSRTRTESNRGSIHALSIVRGIKTTVYDKEWSNGGKGSYKGR